MQVARGHVPWNPEKPAWLWAFKNHGALGLVLPDFLGAISCNLLSFPHLPLLIGSVGFSSIAFLPPYAPELNPVEYLWAWLKRHALANFCPENLHVLRKTARSKLRSAQRRTAIIVACWKQAELF